MRTILVASRESVSMLCLLLFPPCCIVTIIVGKVLFLSNCTPPRSPVGERVFVETRSFVICIVFGRNRIVVDNAYSFCAFPFSFFLFFFFFFLTFLRHPHVHDRTVIKVTVTKNVTDNGRFVVLYLSALRRRALKTAVLWAPSMIRPGSMAWTARSSRTKVTAKCWSCDSMSPSTRRRKSLWRPWITSCWWVPFAFFFSALIGCLVALSPVRFVVENTQPSAGFPFGLPRKFIFLLGLFKKTRRYR